MSEAEAVVEEVKKFINPLTMNGIDIGSSGSPIFPQTISLDINPSSGLLQWRGDARDLSFLRDGVLDYVFSSHCWEDFTEVEKTQVLGEWVRVLKTGGYLMLLLPDEHRYRACCQREGHPSNPAHKDKDFSLEKTRSIIHVVNGFLNPKILDEVYAISEVGEYSFFIVLKLKE